MDFSVQSLLHLLDTRKAGKLNIDNVNFFFQNLSNAPSVDDAGKLFRSFDTSSSGELDVQAFQGLLNALEALLNRTTVAIIKEFLAKQFEKFFLTVCEISRSPSANSPKPIKERYIDKKDVQSALESCQMFPSHWTSTDKINLFKKRFTYNTLSFDDFCTLFATCIEGKNLAEVFKSFEEAQSRRSAARSAFEGGGGGGGGGPASNRDGAPAVGSLANRIASLSQPAASPPSNVARPPPTPPRVMPDVKAPTPVAAVQPKAPLTPPVGNKSMAGNASNAAAGGGGGSGDKESEAAIPAVKLAPALAFLAQPLKPDEKEMAKKEAEEKARKDAEAKVAEDQKPPVDEKVLKEAFNLMDVRKSGGLRLDDALFFCEHLPQDRIPIKSTLHKIYKDCDDDGSGEIEMPEFLEFTIGLERATNMKADAMLAAVIREMYRRLFDMADEDKGGTIGRDELQLLMDCVSGMKAAEVERITKSFPEELNLDDFIEVIKRLTKGRSIAEVTAAFQEGQARRAASAEYAKKLEEETKKKEKSGGGDSESCKDGECPKCVEKRKKVASLMSQLEALQTQVDAETEKNKEKAQHRRRRLTMKKDGENSLSLDSSDILRGNLWETMYASTNVFSAPFYSGCPALARPLMLRLAGSRVNGVADSISMAAKETKSNADAAARWINEVSKSYFDSIHEIQVITDTFKVELKGFFVAYEKLLGVVSATEFVPATATQLCEEMVQIRGRSAVMRPDLERCSDTVVELSVEAANRILCAAPFTNIPSEMAKVSAEIEDVTFRLRDIIAVALQVASSQLLDVEVWARRLLEKTHDRVAPESLAEMKAFSATTQQKLTPEAINDVVKALDDKFRDAMSTLRRTATYRRDKGVMTLSEEEIMAELAALEIKEEAEAANGGSGSPGSPGDGSGKKGGALSGQHADPNSFSPTRMRRMLDKSVDAIKEIDRALQTILKERPDVPLPSNFQRIDATQNAFTFGTRVIELVPIDRAAAVKVGGGYMFLEEFCKRNFEQEVRKLEWANKKFSTAKVEIGKSGMDRDTRFLGKALSSKR